MLTDIILQQKDAGIGHCDMMNRWILPEKFFHFSHYFIGIVGINENRVNLAFRKMLLDVVRETMTSSAVGA